MLKNYLKIAIKVLLRRKFFTFISLFGISFTLVVLMVVVAFLDHIFGPLPPETRLNRSLGVFTVFISSPDGSSSRSGAAGYNFLDRYVRTLSTPEKVSIFTFPRGVNSYQNGQRKPVYLKYTDGAFWEILDFEFLEGQAFTQEDNRNANDVAVINEATRKNFFGDANAVGKTIAVDGQNFRVVGVVKNTPIFRLTPFSDVWVPLSTAKAKPSTDLTGNFLALILAKDRADFAKIKEEFQDKLTQVEFADPREFNTVVSAAETFFETIARGLFANDRSAESYAGRLLAIIVVLMIMFMVLPTVNLVNLNVSRIMERASEIGVRKAFGASSWVLVGQFVVENVLLTLIGGVLGFIFAVIILHLLTNSGLIQYAEFHMNYRIFFYGLCLVLFFGVFSGVYPAWKMSRLHPVAALRS
ncbi:ABC transporter permease [candidate division KSB1 bacterium]|nr:ABC transporter permease [candidate division KSB1 bacterium]